MTTTASLSEHLALSDLKSVAVNLSLVAGTAQDIVAANAERKLRLVALYVRPATATRLQLLAGATAKTGEIPTDPGGDLDLAERRGGWFTTAKGEAIRIRVPTGYANSDVDGIAHYVELQD